MVGEIISEKFRGGEIIFSAGEIKGEKKIAENWNLPDSWYTIPPVITSARTSVGRPARIKDCPAALPQGARFME